MLLVDMIVIAVFTCVAAYWSLILPMVMLAVAPKNATHYISWLAEDAHLCMTTSYCLRAGGTQLKVIAR